MDNKKKEKSEGEKLAEKLLSDKKNGGLRLSEEKLKKADKFCEGYKSFLNTAKTEREAVIEAVAQAEKAGFKPYEKGKKYDAGDKFYFVNRGKAIILTVMGKDDPVFCVTDILPHLADTQMKRPAPQLIKGEELNLLIGSRPFRDDAVSNKVKLNIMAILNEKYGIVEDDFVSAELEAVPAFKAQDVGFDRSMVGSYGQDDRVCAYTALQAILKCKDPKKTCMTILTDKEETGSDGNTGLNSSYLPYFIADLAKVYGLEGRNVISASECLSADVNAAYDPTFSEPFEIRNSSQINYGVVATKFTGARGKSGTSDASAEFVGRVRKLFDEHNIVWQTGELGKVDGGGGGTVAQYIANLDMNVIDVGVPVLSMHAPFEITSKIDTYMAYKAFSVFFAD